MICIFCNKECKNLNSLRQHEIRCKLNPNKIEIVSNFIEYNKKKDKKTNKSLNQFTKAKMLGLDIPVVSDETKKKISNSSKNKKWDDDRKQKHSLAMLKAVDEHPNSYSANNISGRTKSYIYKDSLNNDVKVKGTWELLVAKFLTINNINWTNIIDEKITYEWVGKERRYFPDFYLIDYDIYIEVKGYERKRDLEKWKVIKDKLLVFKKNEINLIKNNNFDIFIILNNKRAFSSVG